MKKRITAIFLGLCLLFPMMFGGIGVANDDPIVIGLITALTGPTSLWGTQERNGALLRVEEINATGGVLGRQIEFIPYDHKGNPQEGVSAYRRLVDQDKASVVLGTHFSNISLAIAPVAERRRVPILGQPMEPKVMTPAPGRLNKFSFLAQPSAIEQGQMMARFGLEDLKLKTAAVLTDRSNSYSLSQAQAFAELFEANGGEVVSFIGYPAGTVDYRSYMTQISRLDPDILYLPQYAQPGGMQVRQAREAGIDAVVLGSNSLSDPPFMNAAGGPEAVEGVYFLFNVNFDEEKFSEFLGNYNRRFGEDPVTYHCLFGYDDVTLAVEAIKNAGSTDPLKIRDEIARLKEVPILMGDGYFTMNPENHRPVNMPSWVFKWVENGEREPVKPVYPEEVTLK